MGVVALTSQLGALVFSVFDDPVHSLLRSLPSLPPPVFPIYPRLYFAQKMKFVKTFGYSSAWPVLVPRWASIKSK